MSRPTVFSTIATNAIHAGAPDPKIGGAVVTPIFQSANFLQRSEGDYHEVRYMRLSNTPNHLALASRICALEGTESATVTSSGMSAITTTLLALLKPGNHILAHRTLYGGTQMFLNTDLPRLEISHSAIDSAAPDTWQAAMRPNTKLIYVEGISNPLMEVGDLTAVVAFAKKHGILSVIDNTIPSPVNFRPADIGFDIVLHSATKYYNGHSDIVAGIVAGRQDLVDIVKHLLAHLGGSLDSHACFLLERGLKTIALRVEKQNSNALALATYLESRGDLKNTLYPGLESCPGHKNAKSLFRGYGGMLSFYAGAPERAERFLNSVRIPAHAASLGGVESLVVRPAFSSHLGMTPAQRAAVGVTDDLVRVSVGIEDIQELVDDFSRALDS